jgi:hypothetical protein
MNKKLYDELIRQYGNSVSHSHYMDSIEWVKRHLERLCTEFGFLEIGKPVKHTISGITRVSNVRGFIMNASFSPFIGIDTGFGNIWYYKAEVPMEEEIEKYDGHCLICSE